MILMMSGISVLVECCSLYILDQHELPIIVSGWRCGPAATRAVAVAERDECSTGNARRDLQGWITRAARLLHHSTATTAYVFIQSQLLVVECIDTLNVNSTFTPRHYRLSVTISCDVFTLINCYSDFPATIVLLF